MARYLSFAIALGYFFGCFVIFCLPIMVIYKIQTQHVAIAFMITLLVCLSSAFWLATIHLLRSNVRQPVFEEQVPLLSNFNIVCERCKEKRKFQLFILEDKSLLAYAFGVNKIVISRAMFEQLGDRELQAVMAHELGHLRSGDCLVQSFIKTAGWMPMSIEQVGMLCWKVFCKVLNKIHVLIFIGISIALFVYAINFVIVFAALILNVFLAKLLRMLFHYSWLAIMRFAEYRQDAFAASLGYADDLRTVLLKLVKDGAGNISKWHTWKHETHPIIYNRIRKLENYIERLNAT